MVKQFTRIAQAKMKQAKNPERDYAKYCEYGQAIKYGPVKDDFCQRYLQIAMGRMDTEEKATTCAALFDKRPDDGTLNLAALCAGVDYTNVPTPFDFDELVQTRLDEDLPAEWCDGLSERAARRQPVCLEIKARKQEEEVRKQGEVLQEAMQGDKPLATFDRKKIDMKKILGDKPLATFDRKKIDMKKILKSQ